MRESVRVDQQKDGDSNHLDISNLDDSKIKHDSESEKIQSLLDDNEEEESELMAKAPIQFLSAVM